MNEFNALYNKLMLEMARPSTLGPQLLDPELFQRYTQLLSKVNNMFKYGVHKYPNLIDFKGEEAYGLADNVLQDRKLRYFYFCLTKHYKHVDYDNSISIDHEILRSIMDIKLYTKRIDIPKNIGAIRSTTYAILNKIKEAPQWFLSKEFERALFDPTLVASYMNAAREKFHSTSINAAAKREQEGGAHIRELDKNRAATRDEMKAKSIKQHSEFMKQFMSDPKRKKNIIKKQKAFWADPKMREQHSEKLKKYHAKNS